MRQTRYTYSKQFQFLIFSIEIMARTMFPSFFSGSRVKWVKKIDVCKDLNAKETGRKASSKIKAYGIGGKACMTSEKTNATTNYL